MSKTSLQVLGMLASGNSLSGELIGQTLGISRMAVSKAIKGLNQRGLNITSVSGKGYQLESPVQLLDKEVICSALSETVLLNSHIEILQQIESTSDYLLQQSETRDINRAVCLAECQNSGRGRRQREWHATPYRNIILSMGWCFDEGMAGLSGLGIAAGITIARTMHEAGFDRDIGLKWPNDIVWNDSKLGGLLIDVRGEHDGPCLVVMGLGLNLALSEEDQKSIDQVCVSLEQITNNAIDRNSLVIDLIRALTELFETYTSSGFESYQHLWTDYDCLYNREVKVIRGEASFSGIAMGIDEFGALLLDEGKEPFSRFLSGDVSLRLAL
ncbi:MAG TPA: biotin--[acetyl-CoA-carboxylase] ligase [Gammaproteobacteria bacterium]|nr:bifunctional ligase/repressor BirA [bacterium BMS3Abin11]GMT39266.1 MAG: bifunctional ligase/repressor BirA [bacterium]HDH16307.1 biotin--[acetyl-CoA-carboxylase] ligase [Gammaproteobacteria bacterium]HDZ78422.1 biotin--[acetyl-CoA-carboxylase] ligase [Gammaproteobacteria bacterium]